MKRVNIFSRLGRKKLIILFPFLLIIVVAISFTILFIHSPTQNKGGEGAGGSVTVGSERPGSNCTSTGAAKNPEGTYTFSWLHVDAATYTIRDENNCILILRGIVQPAAFGDGGASITQQEVQLLSQNIHINFWRLNLNPVWWNTNVIVPKVHMPYQQWMQTLVGWMKANGMYVELDKGPQFTEPPCGGANVFCPHQDAGSLEAAHHALPGDPDPDDPNAWQETSDGSYMDPAIQMWTSVAKLYANDPAIIYDTWNEAHQLIKTNPQQWQANQNLLIDTIRKQNPRSLTVIYIDPADINTNLHYHQDNVVYDFHVYPFSYGANNWPSNIDTLVHYAHQDGHAVIFNEWGGKVGAVTEPYNTNMIAYARANNIGLGYYEGSALYDHNTLQLNDLGQALKRDYASVPWIPFELPHS